MSSLWNSIKSVFSFESSSSSGKTNAKTVLLGLDAAGKTTMLYRLKQPRHEVIMTIPTIGFNLETVKINRVHFTCWDVGGCDKIRPLWRHFMEDVSFLMFMQDAHDQHRNESAASELKLFLESETIVTKSLSALGFANNVERNMGKDGDDLPVPVPPAAVAVLVFANKQDLPHAQSCEEVIRGLCLNEVIDFPWFIAPTTMMDPPSKRDPDNEYICREGVVHYSKCSNLIDLFASRNFDMLEREFPSGISSRQFFSRISTSVPEKLPADPTLIPAPVEESVSGNLVATEHQAHTTSLNNDDEIFEHERRKRNSIWIDWLTRSSDMPNESDDSFLTDLANCTLASWDHLTHVRIAFIFIKRLGMQAAFIAVDQSIDHYIQHSDRTNGKSFHPTMTRFWCHMIAYWSSKYFNVDEAESVNQFHKFLIFVHEHRDFQLTDIANGALFKTYYSSGLIFSESAKSRVVQPDLNDLPSVGQSPSISVDDFSYISNCSYWQKQ